MQEKEPDSSIKLRAGRRRTDAMLIFNDAQEVPDQVFDAILEEWLVPSLVEQFLRERNLTRQSLLARYRNPY
jgi:hypothetical protein